MAELFPTFTHDELVQRAAKWLKGRGDCSIVFAELTCQTRHGETPDAIGFSLNGSSTLVECKATRSDFLSDKKKSFRYYPDWGMGSKRYYMCPPETIHPDDLPPSWGLIWVKNKICKVIREAGIIDNCKTSELTMLISAINRVAMVTPEHFPGGIFTNITYNAAAAEAEAERVMMRKLSEAAPKQESKAGE